MVLEINHTGPLFLLEVADVLVKFVDTGGVGRPEDGDLIIRFLENLLVIGAVRDVEVIAWANKKGLG